MFPMIPRIDPEIARLAPGFCALSIVVEAAPVIDTLVGERALARACAALGTDEAPWALEHLAAWDQVFKGFGAKPARTPCSAQALRKRVLRDGVLPAIDPVVDLYNAISIEYAIPVGGEDLAAYVGAPRLVIADGSECFDTPQRRAANPGGTGSRRGGVAGRSRRHLSPLELAPGDPHSPEPLFPPDVVHSGVSAADAAHGLVGGRRQADCRSHADDAWGPHRADAGGVIEGADEKIKGGAPCSPGRSWGGSCSPSRATSRLCHPPFPTACEHISKQRNTATRRADIAPWNLPRRGRCTRPFQRA